MMTHSAHLTEAVRGAIEKHADLKAVLDSIKESYIEAAAGSAGAPAPTAITDSQRAALAQVTEVYGSVVPTERRSLTPAEVESLMAERLVLDEVKKMVEARSESLRTTVFNHLDVEAEAAGVPEGTGVDKDGHYILAGETVGTEAGKKFRREVRTSAPTLNADALKGLVDSGDLAHDDYLAMTTQVRVVDENKVMLTLKKRPELIGAVTKALRPARRNAALWVRKA